MLELSYNEEVLEAGVDEAGRGCLAGPVFAAAVILPPKLKLDWYEVLNDSKKLPGTLREKLRQLIERDAMAWSVAMISADEIDRINILNATFKAMHDAIRQLKTEPEFLLIDGNRFPKYHHIPHKCMVKGDGTYLSIAAASILAKTHRDTYMKSLHREFPQYAWDKNKAYGTETHVQAIRTYGYSPHHRRSFQLKELQLSLF
ncbi:MAG: ribonuclease HII [Bacteroidetes bacterium]|nr:ribonuclease HII [Bacteroidota bacterium]